MNKLDRRFTICLSLLAFVIAYFGLPYSPLNPNLDEPTFADVSAFVQSRLIDPNHNGEHTLSLDPNKVLTVTSASNLFLSRFTSSGPWIDAARQDRVLFAEISADLSLQNDDGVTITQTVSDHVIQINSTCFEVEPFVFRTELNGIVFSPGPDVVPPKTKEFTWKAEPKMFPPNLVLLSAIVATFVYGACVLIHKRRVARNASFKADAA